MAITFPQFKVANNGGAGSSLSATFTNPIAAGSIIAVMTIADTGITSFTIADDKSDGYTDSGLGIVTDSTIGAKAKTGAFLSATTGAQTVTVTPNVSFGFCEVVIWEIAGLTGAVIDKAIQAPGTGNNASSGSTGTLSASAEAAIGYGIGNDTYDLQGSGWTLDVVTSFADICEHQILASNASIAATAHIIGSPTWRMWCVTFMSGGSSPGPLGSVIKRNWLKRRGLSGSVAPR